MPLWRFGFLYWPLAVEARTTSGAEKLIVRGGESGSRTRASNVS